MRFIAGGLDFDGTYLLCSGEQKIYFIEVPVIIREGMIEKLVSGSRQHLGNQILVNIAQIGGKFVGKKFLVDDVFSYVLVGKSKRNAAGPEENCFPYPRQPELSDNGVHSRRVALELP